MKQIKLVLFIFCTVFVLNSCSKRLVDFTLISSKNVDLHNGADFIRGQKRVKGKDVGHIIIFIPTGYSMKDALDRAIEATPGCVALLDGVIREKSWWIPYIYGQERIIVEGLPLIDPNLIRNKDKLSVFDKKSDIYIEKIDQEKKKEKKEKEIEIEVIFSEEPKISIPIGGKKAFTEYIRNNINYSYLDDCSKKEVTVSFYTTKGRPSYLELSGGCIEAKREIKRLISDGPNWTTGNKKINLTIVFN